MILKPDYNVVSLFDIDFEGLKKEGINVLMFDLDSTVMPSKSGVFPEEVKKLLGKLQYDFVVAIISNNKNEAYIEKVKKSCDFDVIGHANKPSPKVMEQYLSALYKKPSEAVMIGDRPLTDILAGKLLGCKTILVDSITRETENIQTRFVRKLERITIRK